MHLFFYILVFMCFLFTNTFAQTKTFPKKDLIKTDCGSDSIHKKLMESDSAYRKKNEDFEKLVAAITNGEVKNKQLPIYKIPVVFYLMNPGNDIGTGANLTDQQIQGALRYMNKKLQESPVTYNDSLGVVLQLELVLSESKYNNTGIVRLDMANKKQYVKKGVKLGNHKGITVDKLKASVKIPTNSYYTIYLINKINEQDCSGKKDNFMEGYTHFVSSPNSKTAETFILGCSFSDINNNSALTAEFINALSLNYIIKKNDHQLNNQSQSNYEYFFQNHTK